MGDMADYYAFDEFERNADQEQSIDDMVLDIIMGNYDAPVDAEALRVNEAAHQRTGEPHLHIEGLTDRTRTTCGRVSRIGRPSRAVGVCVLPMGHGVYGRPHHYADLTPSNGGRCLVRHQRQERWCTRPHLHSSYHSYTNVPPEYRLIPFLTAPRKDADTTMKSQAELARELRLLTEQEELIAARKAEVLRQSELRAALPEEPPVDSVIKFRIQHVVGGVVYTYVAFRSNRNGASWHTTSKTRSGPYSWDDMLNLMGEDAGVKTGASTLEFYLFDGTGKWVRR